MSIFFQLFVIVILFIIAGVLNEILGELRLAKKDREDERSQKD